MKTRNKRLIRISLALLLAATLLGGAAAAGGNFLRVLIHGEEVAMTDANGKAVSAFLEDGTTYVPARAISEALGLDVSYDKSSKTVSIDGFAPYYRTSKDYDVIPITMSMQAGFQEYEDWTSGMRTIHAGIGYIDPFGVGSYHAGIGYAEAADYPLDAYFSDWFMANFATNLFCIYHMEDGDIYAWDGIFGAIAKDAANFESADNAEGTVPTRSDVLVNVIVGGTGAYEGATGILVGTTSGGGVYEKVTDDMVLPQTLFKLMEGYIKLPKDPSAAAAPTVTDKLSEDYSALKFQGDYAMVPLEMRMQAGSLEYDQWTSGAWTIHSGVGVMTPFGHATYHAGMGYDEAADIPASDFFNENWLDEFDTNLFCIYHIDDGNVKGDLYVYDGIFGAMLEDSGAAGSQAQRQDALINIVVGGTGDFEGATGILVGRTLGSGEYSVVGQTPGGGDYTLPLGLLKLMSGYIKVPASSPVAEYGFDLIKG